MTIPIESVPKIEAGEATLYLFGYVDYADRLTGKISRGGWGRRYFPKPPTPGNNLAFIENAGYLYDRFRLPSEAGDWDNTT